ncbi:hypothetical protein [uncultured Umboniibacter sp.]|uniref:hypothetical protein n=1 Tax=uncultured Umboniibacter sp. TaxID=1798917 RepID=UPI0026316171|nr:hypothetical protein [uncultured Umboniibacter sp.]
MRWFTCFAILVGVIGCEMGTVGITDFTPSISHQIAADGSKRFRFEVHKDMDKEVIRSANGRYDAARFASEFDNLLEKELKDTRYCRDGYFVIDRLDHPRDAFIFGECNEGATPEDITRWGEA